MARTSAGLLLYRWNSDGDLEVLLVHPGGPIWAHRDAGAWSIPKGEYTADEDPAARAEAEFAEELGQPPPPGRRVDLGEIVQAGGKRVRAWAVHGDIDVTAVTSNQFEMEWPPRSGQRRAFPEVDRAAWCALPDARAKLNVGQLPLLDRLPDAITTDDHDGACGG
ncbi:MAG TPA: NUDIX domain-containing protein [Acidimicrobiales bacterium]|nr:NUDIX domain-containing protein [Acidimicrobiales bacterium]